MSQCRACRRGWHPECAGPGCGCACNQEPNEEIADDIAQWTWEGFVNILLTADSATRQRAYDVLLELLRSPKTQQLLADDPDENPEYGPGNPDWEYDRDRDERFVDGDQPF